jgi:hypothetical protein
MFKTRISWLEAGLEVASYLYMAMALVVIWLCIPLLGEPGKLIFVFSVVNALVSIVFDALISAQLKKISSREQ